jgi:SAM-dependent methyltransferase
VADLTTLFDRYYFGRPSYVGGTTAFHTLCSRWLGGAQSILEVGAGPPNSTSTYLATIGRVTGVDLSAEVFDNPALSDARTFDGVHLPFADACFDGCVSNYVLEHVEDVETHFREIARVLRPSGCYLFRTPNLYHYVALSARVLSHTVHASVANRLRALPADAHEPWPTRYRANTPRRIRGLADKVGFHVADLTLIEPEPSYARASRMLFYPLMAYERLVNSGSWAQAFRANILGVLQRPA